VYATTIALHLLITIAIAILRFITIIAAMRHLHRFTVTA
jgi:hypothetical protein